VHSFNYQLLSIAPMIDWTYSHFRVFMRLLAPHALLYTEMQTTGAIKNNPQRALSYQPLEHPIALQLGGSEIDALVDAAKSGEQAGYDEINLNLGCPSDKVQAGRFGACLMKEADHVAECIKSLRNAVAIPVSAKIRIGIDDQDSYEFFSDFAHQLVNAGCQKLIVHARKAWLQGLSPKQNRTIPPVNYDYVYQIKKEIPDIPVIINGNVSKITDIQHHLSEVDGVMLGRLACDNPYEIAKIHQVLYPAVNLSSRSNVFTQYREHIETEYDKGVSLSILVKPIFNLASGLPGSRQWKKKLMYFLQSKNVADLCELSKYLKDIDTELKTEHVSSF